MQSSPRIARSPASEPPESTSDESFQDPNVDEVTQMSPMMNQFQIHSSRNVDLSSHHMYCAQALQPSVMTFQLSDTMLQPVDDPENRHTLRRLVDMSIVADHESEFTHPHPSSRFPSSSFIPFGGAKLQGPSMRLQHDGEMLSRTSQYRVPAASSNSISFPSPHSPTNDRVGDRRPSGSKQQKKSKMHQCEKCKKMFPRPSGLATHMNSHSGAKRMSFTSSSNDLLNQLAVSLQMHCSKLCKKLCCPIECETTPTYPRDKSILARCPCYPQFYDRI
jgi:hypothetical protein